MPIATNGRAAPAKRTAQRRTVRVQRANEKTKEKEGEGHGASTQEMPGELLALLLMCLLWLLSGGCCCCCLFVCLFVFVCRPKRREAEGQPNEQRQRGADRAEQTDRGRQPPSADWTASTRREERAASRRRRRRRRRGRGRGGGGGRRARHTSSGAVRQRQSAGSRLHSSSSSSTQRRAPPLPAEAITQRIRAECRMNAHSVWLRFVADPEWSGVSGDACGHGCRLSGSSRRQRASLSLSCPQFAPAPTTPHHTFVAATRTPPLDRCSLCIC